jgi:hypothetical protein
MKKPITLSELIYRIIAKFPVIKLVNSLMYYLEKNIKNAFGAD